MWRKPILELRGLDDRNYSVVDYVTGKSLGTVSGGITTAHSSNVKFPDGSIHDVMVLPSMANIVRGVDAHDGAALWSVTLGTPVNGNTAIGPKKTVPDGYVCDFPTIDCHAINDKWGVLSTGVIDPDAQRVYLVSWISPDGTPQNVKHFVFVLNVADGTQVVAPVLVTGTSGTQSYSSTMRKQRSSLVLTNVNGRKTVFWASGTVQETGNKAAGWIFAFDCATNSIAAALATSQGEGAGIWMCGPIGSVRCWTSYLISDVCSSDLNLEIRRRDGSSPSTALPIRSPRLWRRRRAKVPVYGWADKGWPRTRRVSSTRSPAMEILMARPSSVSHSSKCSTHLPREERKPA